MDSNTWDLALLSLRALGSVISTVVPIEQDTITRALQLEEEKFDREQKINQLKGPLASFSWLMLLLRCMSTIPLFATSLRKYFG